MRGGGVGPRRRRRCAGVVGHVSSLIWPPLSTTSPWPSHLSAYERRIQAQRLKAELAQAKREAAFYVSRAEAAKSIAAQERRKLAVAAESRSGGGAGASAAQDMVAKVEAERRKVRRRFHQVAPVADSASKVLSSPLLQKMMGGTASSKKRKRTGAGAAAGTKHARKASQ